MVVTNEQLADIFEKMATLLEIKGDSVFKIRAYQRAARTIENLPVSLENSVRDKQDLKEIPGIGKAINDKIYEYVGTGRISAYDKLVEELPQGILTLMTVPSIGPKTATLIANELNVTSIEELEQAILDNKVSGINGIGKKTAENILRNVQELRTKDRRTPIGVALPLAEMIIRKLQTACQELISLYPVGSLRRWEETIGDIDIVCISPNPTSVSNALVGLEDVEDVLVQGDKKTSVVLESGIQLDLRIVDSQSLGAMLQYFTGSQQHNIRIREYANKKGLSVNEYGITDDSTGTLEKFADEESFYHRLDLQYVPPELRVGINELSMAEKYMLPHLIEENDLKGDLHIHTDWSDGRDSMEAMVKTAADLGYEYIAITDHSAGLGVAHGLSIDRLESHIKNLRNLQEKFSIRILCGSEVDIRADGSLDYPDEMLDKLDVVVASIHSAMGQDSDRMTSRLKRAMNHKSVTMIGHLSTRIIGHRSPITFDLEEILLAAKSSGTALELNASPERLDLKDTHAYLAKDFGIPLVLNTDSHNVDGFYNRRYGIAVARRAWCEPQHVLNTLPLSKFIDYISAPKSDRNDIFLANLPGGW